MFKRLKRKVVESIRDEATDYIRESSNEGRIFTGSVVVEGLMFIALMLCGRGNGVNASPHHSGDEIHIHIHQS